MEAQQVEQYATETLSKTWTDPATGNLVDPGTVTIGITRADGTTAVAPGTATSGSGAAARTYNLTATTLLDWLDVTWTSSVYGARRPDRVEVVGGFLFTITQGRTVLPSATVAEIQSARAYAEEQLEAALGYALVPRYALETRSRRYTAGVRPTRAYLRVVRSVTIDGAVLAPADVAALVGSPSGIMLGYSPAVWNWSGWSTITLGYEHGLDRPPVGAVRAALALAADYGDAADDTGIDPRADTITTVDGTIQLRSGGQFGVPIVDNFLAANRLPVVA